MLTLWLSLTQILIPVSLSLSLHLLFPVYENEDQLLWTPDMLSGQAVEEFLLSAQRWGGQQGAKDTLITGDIIKDNDQVL